MKIYLIFIVSSYPCPVILRNSRVPCFGSVQCLCFFSLTDVDNTSALKLSLHFQPEG